MQELDYFNFQQKEIFPTLQYGCTPCSQYEVMRRYLRMGERSTYPTLTSLCESKINFPICWLHDHLLKNSDTSFWEFTLGNINNHFEKWSICRLEGPALIRFTCSHDSIYINEMKEVLTKYFNQYENRVTRIKKIRQVTREQYSASYLGGIMSNNYGILYFGRKDHIDFNYPYDIHMTVYRATKCIEFNLKSLCAAKIALNLTGPEQLEMLIKEEPIPSSCKDEILKHL